MYLIFIINKIVDSKFLVMFRICESFPQKKSSPGTFTIKIKEQVDRIFMIYSSTTIVQYVRIKGNPCLLDRTAEEL
jgi:hypothetical protein